MPRKLSKRHPSFSLPSSSSSIPPTSSPSSSLPTWVTSPLPLPRLIVLDLDYTLWPFYSDIHISPPIRSLSPSVLADRNNEHFSLYPDAQHILHLISSLPGNPIRLAVASKSPVGDLCREVLRSLRLPGGLPRGVGRGLTLEDNSPGGKEEKGKKTIEVFDGGLEIYEGTKLRHFEVISKRTGIPYEEMLFFDDERPNREVEKLGVTMRLVEDGLTWGEVERGVEQWRRNRGLL